MHYEPEDFKHLEEKHELKDIDTSHYTKQMWFDEIKDYLINVMGMNEDQVKKEFDTRFADLLNRGLEL